MTFKSITVDVRLSHHPARDGLLGLVAVVDWLPDAVSPRCALLEISLRHEVLHVHLSLVLRQDDAAVNLLQLDVCHVLPRIVLNSTHLEEVLVACLVVALGVVLGVLLSEPHLGGVDILLVERLGFGCICSGFLILNQVSKVVHLLLI